MLYKSGKTSIEADALSLINLDWELTSEAARVIHNTTMDGCSPFAKLVSYTMMVVPSFQVASGITWLEPEVAMPKQMIDSDWAEAQM